MRKLSRRAALISPFLAGIMSRIPAFAQPKDNDTEWRHYAGDLGNRRYSPLDQIDAGNFSDLEVAWRFKTDSLGARPEYQFESTPLLIKGRLYTTAGSRRDVVALDARTGELIWVHREDEGERGASAPRQLSGHGVSYWTDGRQERILYVTPGYRLIALDARTGVPVRGFGVAGVVDLRKNDDQTMDLVHADIGLHSTPVVVKNVVIVGAAHDSGNVPRTRKNAKGYVRGFDVRTGKRLWIFHTIPRKGEFGYDSWTVPGQAEQIGNTGVWAQISVDEELGLAYLGVELPTGDYSGQYRAGPALFGETIVAVDVQTGKRKWHYQTIHHGLWDRDIPCAAILCDIRAMAKSSRRSRSQASRHFYMSSIARPASRSGLSRRRRFPKAMCRASGIPPPNRYQASRPAMTIRASRRKASSTSRLSFMPKRSRSSRITGLGRFTPRPP
jgi:quinoprotein glucose dehydrogenase